MSSIVHSIIQLNIVHGYSAEAIKYVFLGVLVMGLIATIIGYDQWPKQK